MIVELIEHFEAQWGPEHSQLKFTKLASVCSFKVANQRLKDQIIEFLYLLCCTISINYTYLEDKSKDST